MECPFCKNGLVEQNDCGESWDEKCEYCEGDGKMFSQKQIQSLKAQIEVLVDTLEEFCVCMPNKTCWPCAMIAKSERFKDKLKGA